MYHVSAQGVDERMINVHYYYCYYLLLLLLLFVLGCVCFCHALYDFFFKFFLGGWGVGGG